MRGAIGTIDNSVLFPIPFQYYHMGTNHAPRPSGSPPPHRLSRPQTRFLQEKKMHATFHPWCAAQLSLNGRRSVHVTLVREW